MTSHPLVATPETTLASAAAMMLEGDCGVLPVADQGAIAGVVTDRDLFMALATRNVRASELSVGDVVQMPVWTCVPDDDIQAALSTMRRHRIRRLPVTDASDQIVGIVSMSDILLAREASRTPGQDALIEAMQDISTHHHLPTRVDTGD